MGSASAASTTKKVNATDQRFNTVSIPFVENHGQISDKNVKYSANTFLGNVYVKDNGITYVLTKDNKGWIVSESFLNSNSVTATGKNPTITKVNYYIGKKSQKNLATYKTVQYTNLYTGINLNLKAYGKNIQKIYTIGSTGNPNSIWVQITGSKGLKLNKNGELEILNGNSALKLTKPIAYQIINGKKVNVSVSYAIKNSSYGYKTGAYNKNYNLIIDPLLSSTYLGGNSYDSGQGITVDQAGNVYVTGYTGSVDFPTTTIQQFNNGQATAEWDVFVSKFNSDLSTLIASTYLGGSDSDQAFGIALDNNGQSNCNVFITGITYSNESTLDKYPTTIGAYNTTYNGGGDAFVSKLSNDLSTLKASTFIGGTNLDRANAIIVDASNNVYITGETFSNNFPTVHTAFQETYSGNGDVFVSKFNNILTNLTASTFIGGSSEDMGNALAIDQQNYIYVVGTTYSSNFPVKNYPNVMIDNQPFNNNYKGESDAFIVKLENQHLENLVASSLLGGSARDVGNGVAVDQAGRVYIVGGTWSPDMRTTNRAVQPNIGRNGNVVTQDAFVTIMNKQLQTVLSSTYLGGNGNDVANGVVFSNLGTFMGVVGTTNSTDFPRTNDNFGFEDVFFSSFQNLNTPSQTIQTLLGTTILGGANADYGNAAAIVNSGTEYGNVYLTGNTWANDFPTTVGAFDTIAHDDLQYSEDAFVTKLDDLLDTIPPEITKIDPTNNAVNVAVNKVITIVYNEQIVSNDPNGITINGIIVPYTITGNTITITPNLSPATNYIVNITADTVRDLAGNSGDDYTFNFNTVVPLTLLSTNPVNNAPSVVGNQPIKITFNKNIKTGPAYNLIKLMKGSTAIPIIKTISGNILTITPKTNLTIGTYTLTLPANSIYDLTNKGLSVPFSTSFTVNSPTVASTDPLNNAVNITTNKVIKITFSRTLGNVISSLITLKSSGGTPIPITFSISGNSLYIYHTSTPLAKNTNYVLTLNPNCVVDLGGNGLIATYVTKFKTGSV